MKLKNKLKKRNLVNMEDMPVINLDPVQFSETTEISSTNKVTSLFKSESNLNK